MPLCRWCVADTRAFMEQFYGEDSWLRMINMGDVEAFVCYRDALGSQLREPELTATATGSSIDLFRQHQRRLSLSA